MSINMMQLLGRDCVSMKAMLGIPKFILEEEESPACCLVWVFDVGRWI